MHFTAFVLAALLVISPVAAFIGYSGSNCDGDAGFNVPCDGLCGGFIGRNSFRADTYGTSGAHCVAFFVDGNCSGQRFNFTAQQSQCTAVITGTSIATYRCLPGAGCA